ncbi:MAG: hypothetical protein WCG21_08740 [Eubacteriales bacterium]
MRKTIASILILFMLLSVTVSCSSKPLDSSVNTQVSTAAASTTPSSAADTTAPASTASVTPSAAVETTNNIPTPTVTQTPTKAPAPKTDPGLNVLLDKITYLEEGTAGSSLKQASAAGKILDWVESTKLNQSEVEAQISSYLVSSSDSEVANLLVANFKTVSDTVQLIINGDSSTLASMNDSGYVLAHSKYTQAKWDAFVTAIQVSTDAY